ncbi:reverse transcriptase domain-containing protein [Tanacetum coccineum]
MAAHTERMEWFENAIFKQREEINGRMTEMFGLLKEVTTREEERSDKNNVAFSDNAEKPTETETETPAKKAEKENEAESKPNGKARNKETTEAPSSQPVEYYLKHRINKKLIEGLVDNHRKEDIGGNFKIPCNIGCLKHMNALVDQGSDVNVMPLSTYMKLTDERPAETDIRLSLASHSYIYPLGIAEDILVEVVEHVYPVDFVILDIKEDEKRPFILGTPFLTTAKAVIKFDNGTITLRSGKSKISFHRIHQSLCKIEKGVKNDIDPIAPTMIVNRVECDLGIGVGELTLFSLDVSQVFNFFLQIGLTLIFATLEDLDLGLLGNVISEDDCGDNGEDENVFIIGERCNSG